LSRNYRDPCGQSMFIGIHAGNPWVGIIGILDWRLNPYLCVCSLISTSKRHLDMIRLFKKEMVISWEHIGFLSYHWSVITTPIDSRNEVASATASCLCVLARQVTMVSHIRADIMHPRSAGKTEAAVAAHLWVVTKACGRRRVLTPAGRPLVQTGIKTEECVYRVTISSPWRSRYQEASFKLNWQCNIHETSAS
jgi:hypothetical protein